MTVYIDVLIIFNLYINFFLVKSTALVMRRKVSSLRCLAAAAVGALSSLVILLPPIPFILTFLIKATIACLVTFAAFGRQKIWDHAVCMMFFLLMCFVYGGAMLALWHFAAPLGMVYENGTAYFNIPIGALAVFTAISYGTVRAVRYLLDRKVKCTENCTVAVTAGGRTAELNGFPDTGNSLTDVFSGKPIIICSRSAIHDIIPENILLYLNGSDNITEVRLIPCRTVDGEGLVPVFSAERITVNGKEADAMIGVSKTELQAGTDCIFNPKIISI